MLEHKSNHLRFDSMYHVECYLTSENVSNRRKDRNYVGKNLEVRDVRLRRDKFREEKELSKEKFKV